MSWKKEVGEGETGSSPAPVTATGGTGGGVGGWGGDANVARVGNWGSKRKGIGIAYVVSDWQNNAGEVILRW
jgi:hypothetical protein